VAFHRVYECDPIEIPCVELREEMRERLKGRVLKGMTRGKDDWVERMRAVRNVPASAPTPAAKEPEEAEPQPEGETDGGELLPATTTFVEREFKVMSCQHAWSMGITSGEMWCFACDCSVEGEEAQYVYRGVDVSSTEQEAWAHAGAEKEVFLCVDCAVDSECLEILKGDVIRDARKEREAYETAVQRSLESNEAPVDPVVDFEEMLREQQQKMLEVEWELELEKQALHQSKQELKSVKAELRLESGLRKEFEEDCVAAEEKVEQLTESMAVYERTQTSYVRRLESAQSEWQKSRGAMQQRIDFLLTRSNTETLRADKAEEELTAMKGKLIVGEAKTTRLERELIGANAKVLAAKQEELKAMRANRASETAHAVTLQSKQWDRGKQDVHVGR
jgi:hypothetical protein